MLSKILQKSQRILLTVHLLWSGPSLVHLKLVPGRLLEADILGKDMVGQVTLSAGQISGVFFFHTKGPCYWLVYFIIFLVVLSFGLLSLWTCQHQLSNWCRLPGPSDWWMKIPCWLPKEHGDKLLLVYIVVYLGPFSRNKNHRAYYCSKFFFAVLDILQINPSLIENCRDFFKFFLKN